MISVLVVDDHPGFRAGLRTLLSTAEGIEVRDEAGSGEQALALVGSAQPDVVLMDLAMPGMGGIAAIEHLARDHPHIKVIVLSMSDDDDSVFAAMRAGARGYVLKGARRAELVRSVQTVADGGAVFGPALASRLVGYFSAGQRAEPALPDLTRREREILGLLAGHLTNQQIATRLGLSQKTVRNHVSAVLTKLQVTDRAQAIMRAREAGL
ncbi:DNA-binding NarL/FixJ family response regulator [Streptosporangium becharense]|uniref:DNA-binding NarL/FixJ family response regulator n=1 Tax=Streptosporangium becharense TaxID=1816182 RepID=A0A7W9IFC4_9ACTN|nr:response regulator transcription factor [Streptosporangium becharense]MBB2909753.1 DNA-binding NarL/FixJ family response regulator [Streptosporangium becharense]MBB5819291.1 DNA-binding NarL/FixJ family response regulator [Streptosporangium becharense]